MSVCHRTPAKWCEDRDPNHTLPNLGPKNQRKNKYRPFVLDLFIVALDWLSKAGGIDTRVEVAIGRE